MSIKWPPALTCQKRTMGKSAASAAATVLVITLLLRVRHGQWMVVDALFYAGLLMLAVGCWVLVRWLGLFDLTEYSFKRFVHSVTRKNYDQPDEHPMPEYSEYLQQPRVLPSAAEPLICAGVLIGLYSLIVYAFPS